MEESYEEFLTSPADIPSNQKILNEYTTSQSWFARFCQAPAHIILQQFLIKRVNAQYEEILGLEHPVTLTSMGNVVWAFGTQGQWKEAEELGMQVLEMRERVLGLEHPHTLTSVSNFASSFWIQGRLKEAEKLGMQVMETRERMLGLEHPDTLTSMSNLASTYKGQGRWKDAEELGMQEIEASSRVMGLEHPNTLTSMANLAPDAHGPWINRFHGWKCWNSCVIPSL